MLIELQRPDQSAHDNHRNEMLGDGNARPPAPQPVVHRSAAEHQKDGTDPDGNRRPVPTLSGSHRQPKALQEVILGLAAAGQTHEILELIENKENTRPKSEADD